jgi:hypothetical protein
MKKFNLLAITMIACVFASCGGTKQMVGSQPYYQQPVQQPYYQQPVQQPVYQQPVQQQPAASNAVATGAEGKVKEWEKAGYSITGSYGFRTMYDVLSAVYKKMDADPERYEFFMGSGKTTDGELSTARIYAQNAAAIDYATAAGSVVSGGLARQFSNFSELGTKLMGAYTQKVAEQIVPYLKEAIAVKRTQNNVLEVEAYYLIDANAAQDVRKNAMDKALQETATEQIFGKAVDQWVKEFVSPNE